MTNIQFERFGFHFDENRRCYCCMQKATGVEIWADSDSNGIETTYAHP